MRHPTDIPIEISHERSDGEVRRQLTDVSVGGLSFYADHPIEPDTVIDIRIPLREPAFTASGVVVWCEEREDGWEVGVRFDGHTDQYRLRMVEQVCNIEHYKREIREREGRDISGAEAALEWIAKYGVSFPRD